MTKADIAIIGGGIIGSSIAYHLASAGNAGDILVIERDSTYEFAATPRGSGGIRQLFSLQENIDMSRHALDFYRNFAETMATDDALAPIDFREQGYLFLSDGGDAKQMEANFRMQEKAGVPAELVDNARLNSLFPSVSTEGVDLAIYSPGDAWIDAHAGLQGFRRKARALGASYLDGEVKSWELTSGGDNVIGLASGEQVTAKVVVLAGGAWSAELGKLVGMDLPVEPMSRETYFFRCGETLEALPFIKTETDVAFRPEGSGFTGGMPDWSVPGGWNFELDPTRFESVVWPALANRIPAMQTLKLERGWRGHYARSTFDFTPIIGPWKTDHPGVQICTGFSGHGIMHAPPAGRAIAEHILGGRFESIDLTPYGFHRFAANKPHREKGII